MISRHSALKNLEGISTNILANRLKALEDLGLVKVVPYSNHSCRMNYQLTEQGQSLRPLTKENGLLWGLKHIP